ncbi:DUF2194 domain-containing protein [Oribacterium sp. WCC10]|uniref:DUF2194 domain-containing protein n=1 Tax=Oribacterium sp. WCC10 TaxID=1855343 RepID=UPI000B807338|nr:DUF2194 domain-containing protein [Oribacterium sp. WCC10]
MEKQKEMEHSSDKKQKVRIKRELSRINLLGMYLLGTVFVAFMVALILVQANVRYTVRPEVLELLPKVNLVDMKNTEEPSEGSSEKNNYGETLIENKSYKTLLITEEGDPQSIKSKELWDPILSQMKISSDECDVSDFKCSMLKDYDKIIMAVTKYQKLSEEIVGIKSWVKKGGNLMVAFPPETSGSYKSLFEILGVSDSGEAVVVEGLHFEKDFLIGGSAHDFGIIDAYESSLAYALYDDCEVYVKSTDEYPVPVIWKRKVGKGTVVMDNFGIMDKAYRGIHCAAYSLLGEFCVYPVINGAAFYIDDFPSPVPEGDSTYVSRDYNMSVADFYSQVWWNDIYELGRRYGIHYTGLVIEDYSNQVEGEFPRNQEITRFRYFGNMLLDAGGEIGIHGYNHMPLVLENFDYKDQYDAYIQWPSIQDMRNSLLEVFGFSDELFPDEEFKVYVPPSNVLSEEGRKLLNDTTIRSIAAVYLPTDMAYEQEFEVSSDGIINTPRITSGCVIDEYMELAALSELNFHLVNTHFHHPDDVLDEDRGAALGWKKLYENLRNYMQWLYMSFPNIRNMTGSELAAAVQNYDLLKVERRINDREITLNFGDFNKEAWMLLRVSDGQKIDYVTGGSYISMTDDLYLLQCDTDKVVVRLKQETE